MFTVAVIGCGVIGLSTALAIQKELGLKAKVTIFSEKFSPDTTGDVAAGLWTPYLLESTPEEKIVKWAKCTHDHVLKLWKRGDAKEEGISLLPVLVLSQEENFHLPGFLKTTLGHSEIPPDQLKLYEKKYGTRYSGGYTYMAFTWEASKFLPIFQEKFLRNGGELIEKRIQSLDELSHFDVIVNSTGLQARFLVPDPLVRPSRGQIIRVHAPWQFHTLTVFSDYDVYVIPNHNSVILGGTDQVDNFDTTISEHDKKRILDGCSRYIPGLKLAPVIQDQAGLRPTREQVRLELERRQIGNKVVNIVHNYGHGGGGITLSMGCAEEAAQLVKEALGFAGHSKL